MIYPNHDVGLKETPAITAGSADLTDIPMLDAISIQNEDSRIFAISLTQPYS